VRRAVRKTYLLSNPQNVPRATPRVVEAHNPCEDPPYSHPGSQPRALLLSIAPLLGNMEVRPWRRPCLATGRVSSSSQGQPVRDHRIRAHGVVKSWSNLRR